MVFKKLKHLFNHFQTKDLGTLKYFMGIEIAQSNSSVVMSQRKYVLDIVEEIGMLNCKLVEHSYGSECQACIWTRGSTTSREIELPHHHLIGHFLSCERS